MKRLHFLAVTALLVAGYAQAASKEQLEMQRDIAQLQDQVRQLQSALDKNNATQQTLLQQALDAANKANTAITVLNSNVTQTLERELRDRLTPVAGLASKVDNVSNDMAEVKNSLSDLNTQINRLKTQLTDINNAIKVLQAPPAPPPPTDTGAGKSAPPPPAATLYTNAMTDYSGGKMELALSEFTDFVKFYPEDGNAAAAEMYIGSIHMGQKKYEQAVLDYDTVLEKFPESEETAQAWLMKASALERGGHKDDAIKEYRALIRKYPKGEQTTTARDRLKDLGVSGAAPASPARKRVN